jgi:hypothetical protein
MSRAKRFERLRAAALEVKRLEIALEKAQDEYHDAENDITENEDTGIYSYEGRLYEVDCFVRVKMIDVNFVASDDIEVDE